MLSAGAGTGFFILKSMEANDVSETVEGPAVTDTHTLSDVADAAYSASSKKRRLSVCLDREGVNLPNLKLELPPKNTAWLEESYARSATGESNDETLFLRSKKVSP